MELNCGSLVTSNRINLKKITLATPYDYTTNVGTSTNTVSSSDLESIQDPVIDNAIAPRGLGISSTGSYVYLLEEWNHVQVVRHSLGS